MATGLVGVAETSNPRTSSSRLLLRLPSIRRQDIRWTGGAPSSPSGRNSPLHLELTFENPSPVPTIPATAAIGVAPFGVFLPWKPLARVQVPAISPGGRRVVAETVAGDVPLPPPPSLARDPSPPASPARDLPIWRGLSMSGLLRSRGILSQLFTLARSHHFVGNLNVFVGWGAPVERHLQRSVGLRRGMENFAIFCVGDGREDLYTFGLGEAEPGWEVRIPGVAWGEPRKIASEMVLLSIRPPEHAESGRLSVLVRRESAARTVPVEFELEAGVPGSKCYYF